MVDGAPRRHSRPRRGPAHGAPARHVRLRPVGDLRHRAVARRGRPRPAPPRGRPRARLSGFTTSPPVVHSLSAHPGRGQGDTRVDVPTRKENRGDSSCSEAGPPPAGARGADARRRRVRTGRGRRHRRRADDDGGGGEATTEEAALEGDSSPTARARSDRSPPRRGGLPRDQPTSTSRSASPAPAAASSGSAPARPTSPTPRDRSRRTRSRSAPTPASSTSSSRRERRAHRRRQPRERLGDLPDGRAAEDDLGARLEGRSRTGTRSTRASPTSR